MTRAVMTSPAVVGTPGAGPPRAPGLSRASSLTASVVTSAPALGARVAYLLPDPGIPVGGTKGASVHVDSLCGALAQLGYEVTLFAARVTGPLSAPGSEQVAVVSVDVGSVRSGLGADAGRMDAAERFFEAVEPTLAAEGPDWVHERLSLFAGEGTAMASRLGLPRVVEVNAPVAAERQAHFSLSLRDEAAAAERAALAGVSVVAVSEPLAAWAATMGAARTAVVSNGAILDPLGPSGRAEARYRHRHDLGFGDRCVVVGFTGSLKPWHGVELLVEAVGRASARSSLGLLIVGDGPGRQTVERAVAQLPGTVPTAMTGAVPLRAVPGYLAAMDVAVAPYLPTEAFYFSPLKVAEAMASHVPVIASDFPPVRELLGESGVLVPPGHPAALADAIVALAADAADRRRRAADGWARAVARLSWQTAAQRVAEAVPLKEKTTVR